MNKSTINNQYLSRVALQGYKCVQNVDINLENGLNVIIGKNGTGKTNFFNFLNNALYLKFDDYVEFKSDIYISDNENKYQISAYRDKNEPSQNDHNIISKSDVNFVFTMDGVVIQTEASKIENEIYAPKRLKYQSNIIKHGIPNPLPLIDTPFNVSFDKSGRANFLNFSLLTDSSMSYFLRAILCSFLFNLKGSTPNDKTPDLDQKKDVVKNIIESTLSEILPSIIKFTPIQDIRLNEGFNLYFDEAKNEIIANGLVLEYKVNNSWLPFSSLSDGTKRIFIIISDLSINNKYIFRKNSVGISMSEIFPRIVLIEEPELGIHPHQLHLLMIFLVEKSKTNQIIITTHSPQVIDVIEENQLNRIIICQLDSEKGTLLRHMTLHEQDKARAYINDGMYFSDYWRFSNFNRE